MMTASQLLSLKAEVKAEMLRRQYTGSVASYGGAAYDFTTAPAAGQPVLTEHGGKIIQPLLAVKDISGLSNAVQGQPIPAAFDYNGLHTVVTNLAAESKEGNSSCRSSCTGLCEGSCTGGCTGCGSGCTGSCYWTCWVSCGSDCTGGCTGGCKTSCGGDCTALCSSTLVH